MSPVVDKRFCNIRRVRVKVAQNEVTRSPEKTMKNKQKIKSSKSLLKSVVQEIWLNGLKYKIPKLTFSGVGGTPMLWRNDVVHILACLKVSRPFSMRLALVL